MKLVNKAYFYFRNLFSRYFPALYNFFEARKKICKFIVAGFFSGTLDLALLFLMHGVFGWNIIFSTTSAFIFAFAASFFLQKIWTFRNHGKEKIFRQLGVYFFNAFFDMNLNGLLMHLLVNRFDIWYLLAQLLINAAIGLLNFFVYKLIIFRNKKI